MDRFLFACRYIGRHQREDALYIRGDRVAVARGIFVRPGDESLDHRALELASVAQPGNRAVGDALGADQDVALYIGVVGAGAEILGQTAARGGNVGQQRFGLVLHLGVAVAAHDGQQVGAVDVRDAKRVPEDLAPALAWIFGRCGTAGTERDCYGGGTIESAMTHHFHPPLIQLPEIRVFAPSSPVPKCHFCPRRPPIVADLQAG